jgi:hypothetical protein
MILEKEIKKRELYNCHIISSFLLINNKQIKTFKSKILEDLLKEMIVMRRYTEIYF